MIKSNVKIEYFPARKNVVSAIKNDEPLLLLIAFDNSEILVAPIDDVVEHTIMLKKMEKSELDIDKYFRVVANGEGSDWTFVCPVDYKNIENKQKRIKQFYEDGIISITSALKKLGLNENIAIPTRYRRHFDMLKDF